MYHFIRYRCNSKVVCKVLYYAWTGRVAAIMAYQPPNNITSAVIPVSKVSPINSRNHSISTHMSNATHSHGRDGIVQGPYAAVDVVSYTSMHLFAEQQQLVNLTVHQMNCGWKP